MSDYLGRAVERETSAASSVRPVLPSLFDPGKSSDIIAAIEPERTMEGERFPSPQDEAKPNIPSLQERLAAVNALWMDPAGATLKQPRRAGMPSRKAFADLADKPAAAFSRESFPSRREQLPTEATTEPIVGPTEASPAPPQTIIGRTTDVLPGPLLPSTESVVRLAAQSPPEEPRIVPIIGEPVSASPAAIPLTQVVTPTHTTVPRISPAPSSAGKARSPDQGSASRVVHITIGRIEVRAVHPPPEPLPQRPAPASPKISLDEYLKQRNGGRP
jgi:hypothetical protein